METESNTNQVKDSQIEIELSQKPNSYQQSNIEQIKFAANDNQIHEIQMSNEFNIIIHSSKSSP